jgi:NAD(P)-dependent dehydrogenase (short-subunit alcohol dehydrogenase family)
MQNASSESSRPFEGYLILVTGALGAIGQAIIARCLRAGATIVASDLSTTSATPAPAGARFITHDVTKEESWRALAASIEADHGKLNAVVNCAGVFAPTPLADTDAATLARHVDASVLGSLLGIKICRALLSKTAQAGEPASVVNLGSSAALIGYENSSAYSAAKGAVRALSRSAAIELAPEGIRINCIHPGYIDSPMADRGLERLNQAGLIPDPDTARRAIAAATPLGRLGTPQDVAGCVAFLISSDAAYVTGQDFIIDGGYSAR